MCFRIFNFGQIKLIFRGDENLKKIFIVNVNVYWYSDLIKTDKYLRTNCCLVINSKPNRFEIQHMTYNIRYLAIYIYIYIYSLKVCNVRYILSYKH